MAPLVGEAAAAITALVDHNATTTLFLWLLNVQAVLFMGYEGEPRVAGGCIEDDIGNTAIIAQCSAEHDIFIVQLRLPVLPAR